MADEPANLIIEQLRLIRADIADVKRVQADHGRILEQHTITLREHTQTLDGLLSIMGAITAACHAWKSTSASSKPELTALL